MLPTVKWAAVCRGQAGGVIKGKERRTLSFEIGHSASFQASARNVRFSPESYRVAALQPTMPRGQDRKYGRNADHLTHRNEKLREVCLRISGSTKLEGQVCFPTAAFGGRGSTPHAKGDEHETVFWNRTCGITDLRNDNRGGRRATAFLWTFDRRNCSAGNLNDRFRWRAGSTVQARHHARQPDDDS